MTKMRRKRCVSAQRLALLVRKSLIRSQDASRRSGWHRCTLSSSRCQLLAQRTVGHTTPLCALRRIAGTSPEASADFLTKAMRNRRATCGNTLSDAGVTRSSRRRTRPATQMRCETQPSKGFWIRKRSRLHSNGRGKVRFSTRTGNTQPPKQGTHLISFADVADG
jgi:hypothetical protein